MGRMHPRKMASIAPLEVNRQKSRIPLTVRHSTVFKRVSYVCQPALGESCQEVILTKLVLLKK